MASQLANAVNGKHHANSNPPTLPEAAVPQSLASPAPSPSSALSNASSSPPRESHWSRVRGRSVAHQSHTNAQAQELRAVSPLPAPRANPVTALRQRSLDCKPSLPSLAQSHPAPIFEQRYRSFSPTSAILPSPAVPASPQLSASANDPLPNSSNPPEMNNDAAATLVPAPAPNLPVGAARPQAVNVVMTGDHVASDQRISTDSPRRLERMHSLRRPRREMSHKRSHSQMRSQPSLHDFQNVSDYASIHLFYAFQYEADRKIDQCVTSPFEPEPNVEGICGPGVDPSFDQLISSLGQIVRKSPKRIVDALMVWRKKKSDLTHEARAELARNKAMLPPVSMTATRRNTETSQRHGTARAQQDPALLTLQNDVFHAERRSTVAVYLLCRVLMDIISQTTLASLTVDVATRLENVIYEQLKIPRRGEVEISPTKRANWVIFGQLLSVMSRINFDSVVGKFLADLEILNKELSAKGSASMEIEDRAILLLQSMRQLVLLTEPQEAWDRSCGYLLSLATFFKGVHGQLVKHAYCQVFGELLLPVAAKESHRLQAPKWREALEIMKPRLSQMSSKPKHWTTAFPVLALATCASPTDTFSSQWFQLVIPLQPRLKERASRGIALRAICRLVYTYLYRTFESDLQRKKKLDEVVKLVFLSGKRSYLSTDPSVAEPLIQLIRVIGYKHPDLCFRTIVFPLINAEMFAAGREHIRAENLEPEKMVIGIRAFLAIMADLEKAEEPSFPTFNDNPAVVDPPVTSPNPFNSNSRAVGPGAISTIKEERLSKPVMTKSFAEVTKHAYAKFCHILGDITIICDETFGGQAALDEKFAALTPRTPMAEAFAFARKDDHSGAVDHRQGFYDLLHVAVQALPRCLSPHIPFNSLINLLCTGTAHVQEHIARSSAKSLKSIARQSMAQQVTIGFARFIFNFDDRYATMSDGGMLGPDHIESTLRLYVELLYIWIEEIKQKIQKTAAADDNNTDNRGAMLELSGVAGHVDEIESHGLVFLCSPSRKVRSIAVTVLRLVTEFDTALRQQNTRVISIMEGTSQRVIDVDDEGLSVAERSRLQKGLKNGDATDTLVQLCSSDMAYDATLWFKLFPNLIRISFESCPSAVTLARKTVLGRLSQMHRTIQMLCENSRTNMNQIFEFTGRAQPRLTTSPDLIVEQWKLYLVYACTTLMNPGAQKEGASQPTTHSRKSSKSSQQGQDNISTAAELFAKIIPLLSTGTAPVRDAVVTGLGSIGISLFKTLLECLQPAVTTCNEEAKVVMRQAQSRGGYGRRSRTDFLRTEVTRVYKLTSHFLRLPEAYNDDYIMNNLMNYTKSIRIFLNDAEVQNEIFEYQKLRIHFCGLMDEVFEAVKRTRDPMRWMNFQSRKASFTLMEDWCGYSPHQDRIRLKEDHLRRSYLEREPDLKNKGIASAAMEIEKRELRTAALSAMATLCGGPIRILNEQKVPIEFNVGRLLSWISAIFDTVSDRFHAIGRRALKNLITHNKDYPALVETSIEKCFQTKSLKGLESYFEVVTQVLTESDDYRLPFWKVLGAGLYVLGNARSEIRMKSARLLRTMEAREHKQSKLQDLDISISDKTTAIYKKAQFEMSQKLSATHPELAFHVFSGFSRYFKHLEPDHQRNMVAAMLPWIQTVNLQVDVDGAPISTSYMLLANLFEITIACSSNLHNEIQALWQAVATGPYAGNVQVVLDFIIRLCLDRREQNFVEYAKQIVVFLSSTPAGEKVINFLLLQITPRNMVQTKAVEPFEPPPQGDLPYLADLSLALPKGTKQSGLSLGQICTILLVDLVVTPVDLPAENVPVLLQAVLVLWDHYTSIVQDQAREMLVHLIHETVISKIDDVVTDETTKSIEDLVESVRRQHSTVVWSYDDPSVQHEEEDSIRVPEAMNFVALELVRLFSITCPDVQSAWAKTSLNWATSCNVRHLACRSFQIFRCILTTLDLPMLGDMLARLSNTIADKATDVMEFSMEILTTLRTIIDALEPSDLQEYPQLFWNTYACLDSIHEQEFMECLTMLEKLMSKLDLGDEVIYRKILKSKPANWDASLGPLQNLIYKGTRSSITLDRSLHLMERLVAQKSVDLLGDDSRLLYTLLANLPRFLGYFDDASANLKCFATAQVLADVAASQQRDPITNVLNGFSKGNYETSHEFLEAIVLAIKVTFFPAQEYGTIHFLMGLLTNQLPSVKIYTMQVLCVIIPEIDMRKPEIHNNGHELVTPLLQLLQAEFCPQALQVLDLVASLAAPPMNADQLRMSTAGAVPTESFREQYAETESLYGIHKETGWAIPMPNMKAARTRANVHAVFYSCLPFGVSADANMQTPEIEFHKDQYESYFPSADRTATMTSEGDGTMADLVRGMSSIDDFFDDDDAESRHSFENDLSPSPRSIRIQGGPSSDMLNGDINSDTREILYDQDTAPILKKSLHRNISMASFQAGFTDASISTTLKSPIALRSVSNSSAATVIRAPQQPSVNPVTPPTRPLRPLLATAGRTVSSPAGSTNPEPSTSASSTSRPSRLSTASRITEEPLPEIDTEGDLTFFSDDEYIASASLSRTASNEIISRPPACSENIPTTTTAISSSSRPPSTRSKQGSTSSRFSRSVRRLTGGSSVSASIAGSRKSSLSGESNAGNAIINTSSAVQMTLAGPEVPRVPSVYLQNPKSAEP